MMPVLGIDTSTSFGSVALWSPSGLMGLLTVNIDLTHSEGLMPALDQLLRLTRVGLADLAGIACISGPGSYTGLRVGIATAQGIAASRNLPCFACNSLEAMAWSLPHAKQPVCPLLTARKGWVYARFYRWNPSKHRPEPISEEMNLQPEDLIREITQPTILFGPGLPPHQAFFREVLQDQFLEVPSAHHSPRADLLAELAWREIQAGHGIAPTALRPYYLGPSQAETNWLKRRQG